MAHDDKHRAPGRGVREPLRELRRRIRAAQNHPHYVANGKEQALLADLLAAHPPVGGMAAYLAEMDAHDPSKAQAREDHHD